MHQLRIKELSLQRKSDKNFSLFIKNSKYYEEF